jgi:hypothetical protein
VFDLMRREFEALGDTHLDIFRPIEIDTLNSAIQFVCRRTAREISDLSHTLVWEVADIGEVLPYETFLVSFTGDINEKDVANARKLLRDVGRDRRFSA